MVIFICGRATVHDLLSFPGTCVQIPGASLQCCSDSQRDERSGEEEHSQDPKLMQHPELVWQSLWSDFKTQWMFCTFFIWCYERMICPSWLYALMLLASNIFEGRKTSTSPPTVYLKRNQWDQTVFFFLLCIKFLSYFKHLQFHTCAKLQIKWALSLVSRDAPSAQKQNFFSCRCCWQEANKWFFWFILQTM